MNYNHGPTVAVTATSTTNIQQTSMTPVGVVVSADDADATAFPEGGAVSLPDFSADTLAKMGTTGTFKSVFNTLQSQGYQPLVVVVRVAEDADEATVVAAIETLKTNTSFFGFDIKLLAAPGLESSTAIVTKLATAATAIGAAAKAALGMCTNYDEVVTERAKYDQQDLEVFWPATHLSNSETVHVSALAIAARIMIDEEKTIAASMSSKKLNGGIDELSQPIAYSGIDSLANKLNSIQVSTVIRRDGADFCIFGARTTSSNINYKYEMWSRVSNLIKTMISTGFNEYLDDLSTADQLTAVEAEIDSDVIDNLIQAGIIINGFFEFNDVKTDVAALSDGVAYYKYGFGPLPIFEQPRIEGDISLEYMSELVVSTQTS